MKKTKLQTAKKLNLQKNQIATLTAKEASHVAGGARTTIMVTQSVACDLNSSTISYPRNCTPQ
jgi:hypothetical protein